MSAITKFSKPVLQSCTAGYRWHKVYARLASRRNLCQSAFMAVFVAIGPVWAGPGDTSGLPTGHWQAQSQGDRVGLIIHNRTNNPNGNSDCTFYAEQVLAPKLELACQYNRHGRQVNIYLVDASGQCSSTPDFVADWHSATGELLLQIPGQAAVALYPLQRDQQPND